MHECGFPLADLFVDGRERKTQPAFGLRRIGVVAQAIGDGRERDFELAVGRANGDLLEQGRELDRLRMRAPAERGFRGSAPPAEPQAGRSEQHAAGFVSSNQGRCRCTASGLNALDRNLVGAVSCHSREQADMGCLSTRQLLATNP